MCRAAFSLSSISFATTANAMITDNVMIAPHLDISVRAVRLAMVTLVLSLMGCGSAETDPGPGGVNAGDAKALDVAAVNLDQRRSITDTAKPKN